MAQFAHQAGRVGELLYTPASLLVLLFGIGLMTNDQSPWDWDMTFVQIALAGWALTFLVGFFWIRPTAAKLAKTIEAKGPDRPRDAGDHQAHPARDADRCADPALHRLRHDRQALVLAEAHLPRDDGSPYVAVLE